MSKFSSAAASPAGGGKGLVWYRGNDLRVQDHAPLFAAHEQCATVDPVFIFDPRNFRTTSHGILKTGLRRLDFTLECLHDLERNLKALGGASSSSKCLHVLVGHPEEVLPAFMQTIGATRLYTHSDVTFEEESVLQAVTAAVDGPTGGKVKAAKSNVVTFWGGTLVQAETLPLIPLPADLSTLGFFTSFRKVVEGSPSRALSKCLPGPRFPPAATGFRPSALAGLADSSGTMAVGEINATELGGRLLQLGGVEVEQFRGGVGGCAKSAAVAASTTDTDGKASAPLCPDLYVARPHDPRSAFAMPGGETAAWARVRSYFSPKGLSVYKETRNGMLGSEYSSKLSVYLANGCITARQIMHAVKEYEAVEGSNDSTYWLIFELLWRDYMRLYCKKQGNKVFYLGGSQGAAGRAKWPWLRDSELFTKWARGQTGYPLIDANMRELALTGFMSNRGRQIVASFLVRDMGLDWRLGAQHFEALLLDHDVCSNWGNWQYAAGVGADPREDRYFNPVKQGNDYDPQGAYVRAWLPELKALPTRILLDARQGAAFRAPAGPMLPPANSLWMDREPKTAWPPAGGKPSGGGGRGGRGGSGGGGGKPRMGGQGGNKGQQHGSVPGRR